MKRKHTLRSLLSMVCAIVMVVTMVPVLPAAAAADVLYDTMESYTVGTDLYTQAADKYTKTSPANGNATYTSSSQGSVAVATDPTNAGNKVLAVTANGDAKRYILSTVPTVTGDYTLQFDYMPAKIGSNSGSGFLDLFLNGGKTITGRTFFNKNSNQIKFMTTGANLSNVVKPAAPKDNTWYSVRVVISSEEYIMEVWEKGNKDATLVTASATSGITENTGTNVEFCFGPYNASQVVDTSGPITNYIDNIRITSGIVEDTDTDTGAADDGSVSVSGGGMVSFTDADQIVNTEEVAITAGMGLFAGTTEGKFDPTGTVTRAQMATIIVKMLRGNAFNADNFKGYDKFSDTATFEGGWAEGYINACVQMGVVAGYGDGTFKPGNPVTTAEALTMIINALKVDAGEGSWPTTIMAKAEAMKLYGNLSTKPGTYDALTRDQLAVLTYEGMCYSPAGVTGYKVPGVEIVFTDIADALKAYPDPSQIVEVVGDDALANKIYELQIFEGFITANQATGEDEYTTVTAYNADGTTAPVSMEFNMVTGLDEIGHYVTVYYREEYKSDVEPGVVYNYVDETEVVTVDEDITTSKKYKEAFGKSIKEAKLLDGTTDAVLLFTEYYTTSDSDNSTRGSVPASAAPVAYAEGTSAPAGIYFVNDGVIKAYMAPIPVYAAKVEAVNDFEDAETIQLSGILLPLNNAEGNDQVVEYNKIKKDDYVTYVTVGAPSGNANATYILTKATTVKGTVSKTSVNEDGDQVATVKDTEYVSFGSANNATGLDIILTNDLSYTDSYTFYVTEDGKFIGYEMTQGGLDLKTTVFILGQNTVTTNDGYGGKVRKTFARGIDMSGNEVNLLLVLEKNGTVVDGIGFNNDPADDVCDPIYANQVKNELSLVTANTFYSYELSNDKDAKKQDLYVLTPYAATYDAEEDNAYTHTRSISAGANYAMYDFTDSCGKRTLNGSGPVLLLEGSVDQATPLSATISKIYVNQVNTGSSAMKLFHLINRDDSDHAVVRASVLLTDDLAKATASEVVYVAAGDITSAGSNSDGILFDVYDYKTGAARQITIKNSDPALVNGGFDSAGYWHVVPDTDSDCYTIRGKVVDSAATTSASKTNENSGANDQLYNENIYHGQLFVDLVNDKLTTTSMFQASKATDGMVVDTRSEEEITASGLGKINSMDRIASLALDHPEIVVTFDLCYSTGSDKMLTTFVTDVHYTSVGSGSEITKSGTTYYLDGFPVVDASNLIFTDGTGSVSGATTADKMENLVTMAQTQDVAVNYTVANGKVTSITVDCIMPALGEGVLLHDEFSYAVGNLPMRIWQKASTSGAGTATIISGGKLELSATEAQKDIRLLTSESYSGSYTIEIGLEAVEGFILVNLSGVKLPLASGTSESFSLRMGSRLSDCIFMSDAAAELKVGDDSKNYIYMRDPVTSARKDMNTTDPYTLKLQVNQVAKTVTIEIYDKTGALYSTRTLACASIDTSAVAIEVHYKSDSSAQSVLLDYAKITGVPAADTYAIDADPNNYRYGKVSANVYSAAEGATVTITGTPANDCKFVGITVKDETGDDITSEVNVQTVDGKYTFTMPAEAVNVVANFDTIKYSAVTVTNPAEGTVTVTGADDLTNVKEGTVLTISAAATDTDRHALKEIQVNGGKIEEVDGAYTYTVPADGAAITVTAVFDTVYTVTEGTCTNGSVTVDKTGAVAGATVTITPTPAQYYKVKSGSVTVKDSQGGTVTVTDNKFTMPADDVTVTAEFERITYTLAKKVNNADFGSVTLSGDGTYYAGETYTVTATADTGYVAKYILVNGTKVADGGTYNLTVEDDSATTVTAVFWPEGAMFYDDFNHMSGTFDATTAATYGYTRTDKSGTPTMEVKDVDGSQALSIEASRAYLSMGNPTSSSYTLEFDLHTNDLATASVTDILLGNYAKNNNAGNAQFYIRIRWDRDNIGIYGTKTSAEVYTNTVLVMGNNNAANGNYENLVANTWYHFKAVVTDANVTLYVNKRGDEANVKYASYTFPNEGVNFETVSEKTPVMFDHQATNVIEIDNVSIMGN